MCKSTGPPRRKFFYEPLHFVVIFYIIMLVRSIGYSSCTLIYCWCEALIVGVQCYLKLTSQGNVCISVKFRYAIN